ncbi:hypothetical protein CLOM_g21730 [Closterium sp. NIES-68]|nr:hypothetical protein CLOM_g21730 [Closterium sp. NIES-68]GJP60873.1 hypothetical protein CLOP_g18087 [Closterium sp. NIES-67]GJP86757.1 hypothetical protein CLOP_g16742 [Closterium sp. NIES-67]
MDMGEYALLAGARRFREDRERKRREMLGEQKDELYIEAPPDRGGGGVGIGAHRMGLSYGPPSYFPSDPAAVLASAGIPDHIGSIGRQGTGSSLTESSREDSESQYSESTAQSHTDSHTDSRSSPLSSSYTPDSVQRSDQTPLSAATPYSAYTQSYTIQSGAGYSTYTPSAYSGSGYTPYSAYTPSGYTTQSGYTPSAYTPGPQSTVYTQSAAYTPSAYTPTAYTPGYTPSSAYTPAAYSGSIYASPGYTPQTIDTTTTFDSQTTAEADAPYSEGTLTRESTEADRDSITGTSAEAGTEAETIPSTVPSVYTTSTIPAFPHSASVTSSVVTSSEAETGSSFYTEFAPGAATAAYAAAYAARAAAQAAAQTAAQATAAQGTAQTVGGGRGGARGGRGGGGGGMPEGAHYTAASFSFPQSDSVTESEAAVTESEVSGSVVVQSGAPRHSPVPHISSPFQTTVSSSYPSQPVTGSPMHTVSMGSPAHPMGSPMYPIGTPGYHMAMSGFGGAADGGAGSSGGSDGVGDGSSAPIMSAAKSGYMQMPYALGAEDMGMAYTSPEEFGYALPHSYTQYDSGSVMAPGVLSRVGGQDAATGLHGPGSGDSAAEGSSQVDLSESQYSVQDNYDD